MIVRALDVAKAVCLGKKNKVSFVRLKRPTTNESIIIELLENYGVYNIIEMEIR